MQGAWLSDLDSLSRARHGISNTLNSDTIRPYVYGVCGGVRGLSGKIIMLKAENNLHWFCYCTTIITGRIAMFHVTDGPILAVREHSWI